ncbi:MAG: DUF4114 domain-containing protein [bacterium]
MKRLIIVLMLLALCPFLLTNNSMAVTFGDGGVALQAVLDSITVSPPGGSSIDVTTREVPDYGDSYWSAGPTGLYLAMIFEFSDLSEFNEFGIFDAANPSNRVPIFGGEAITASQAIAVILADGAVRVNFIDTGIKFAGNTFGFYLDSRSVPDGDIWYSDTSLNRDGMDHMAAYQGSGDTIQIPGLTSGEWVDSEFILAFEDRDKRTADRDYDDMVLMVENLAPNPPSLPSMGCRFTGGGVDTDENWDHILGSGKMIHNGSGKLPDAVNRYQFGGQAGANTGQQPQPKGEWTHHQQEGPYGDFTFHGGTASAPEGTEIVDIRCSDPGFCFPARPAPVKQLDFDGIGTFKNIGKGKNAPIWKIPNPVVTAEGKGNRGFDGTFHWFEVNIDDLGEPGRKNDGAPDPAICPSSGFGEKGDIDLANCDCPDFYRITIYNGIYADDVVWLPDGNIDLNSLNLTEVLYEVYGYIDGGNLQIHPPTGFDLH